MKFKFYFARRHSFTPCRKRKILSPATLNAVSRGLFAFSFVLETDGCNDRRRDLKCLTCNRERTGSANPVDFADIDIVTQQFFPVVIPQDI